MAKKRNQDSSEITNAILMGDLEKVKSLWEVGSLLYKKGKIVALRENIPQTYVYNGEEHILYVDAFRFALSNQQTEIAKFLIDCNAVDMRLGTNTLFMVIHSKNMELFSYMIEKGAQIEKNEKGIERMFCSLMDAWDEAYFPIIEKMNLPIKECGGSTLCSAAFYNHKELAEYLLSVGVSVNCRENNDDTPILCAAKRNHFEMVQFLVEHGADLSLKDKEGIRPYIAAKKNNNVEMAAYIKAHEPAEFCNEEVQDRIFEDYHVPKDMAAYLKNGNLKLEFPKEERLHWIKLYSYMDVPEITYQGKKLLSLVEDSEDYGVLLAWEPQSRKIWFIDPEHEVFHAVSTWMEFIKNAGYYTNRAIIHEFD